MPMQNDGPMLVPKRSNRPTLVPTENDLNLLTLLKQECPTIGPLRLGLIIGRYGRREHIHPFTVGITVRHSSLARMCRAYRKN